MTPATPPAARPPQDLVRQPSQLPSRLTAEEQARLRALLEAAWAPETRRAYRWGWQRWTAWCKLAGRCVLPAAPEEVALFIEESVTSAMAARRSAQREPTSASTIRTVLSAIRWAHEAARVPSPTTSIEVKHAWKAASVKLGLAARRPKAPATLDVLEQMLKTIDRATAEGKRDAAVLLLGFHGAFRRSELAALCWPDVRPTPGGIAVLVRKSKTDQAGEGQTVGIIARDDHLCAVRALAEWRECCGRGEESSIFGVSAATPARIVQRAASAAGLDASFYGGHSLRAGFVTEAYRRGASDAEVAGTTRHESATTLMRYRREADPIARGASRRMKK